MPVAATEHNHAEPGNERENAESQEGGGHENPGTTSGGAIG